MAPPKNANKHQKPDTQVARPLRGRKVMYVGIGQVMKCATCGHERRRGMVSEYAGQMYCSEACVPQT